MPSYRIRGVVVDFPYVAYDCQQLYMEKTIEALADGRNALLESPTGTGKTLCLLCAALAWRESQRDMKPIPRIFYASRTHSQLSQVVRELKKTKYRPKLSILASREQLCTHKTVAQLRGNVQNQVCRSTVNAGDCSFHGQLQNYLGGNDGDHKTQIMDIEDMVSFGRQQNICPFYLAREAQAEAEIMFLPYNYIVDPSSRKTLKDVAWENSILIFDEAHNLESTCAEASSFSLTSEQIAGCILEAQRCAELSSIRQHEGPELNAIVPGKDAMDPDYFITLKALLCTLEKKLVEVVLPPTGQGLTKPGAFLKEFLGELGITGDTIEELLKAIENATMLLSEEAVAAGQASGFRVSTHKLTTLAESLRKAFSCSPDDLQHFRVHIHAEKGNAKKQGFSKASNARTLSFWCFSPGITMRALKRDLHVRSVILTSGTLAPMDALAHEMMLTFDTRLENQHIVARENVRVGVISTGPSGYKLNSSYQSRDDPRYKQELGNLLVNLARCVPDGLLVFFPSYIVMNSCIESWKMPAGRGSECVWERIHKHKQTVVEPRESSLLHSVFEDFRRKLEDTAFAGAMFLAVCRGKVSEGLDFADAAGRAVVITGIPYANKADPRVTLKRQIMDEQAMQNRAKGGEVVSGSDWYSQQAFRAVNQAIGRVIRHRNDFGAILLCDERFNYKPAPTQLSTWLRPYMVRSCLSSV
eukprot:scaffold1074_cov409-Prasinococcus_capsulatus_cf.AAC.19